MRARARVWFMILALLLAVLAPRSASAAPGFTHTCEQALPKEQIDELVDRMRAAGDRSACVLGRVDTSMFRTLIEWHAGAQTHAVLLGPRGCVIEPSHVGADLAYYAPPELGEACPEAVAELRAFVGEPREELVPVVRGQAPELSDEPDAIGLADPLVVASTAWLAMLILTIVAGVQRWRVLREDERARREARQLGLAMAAVFVLGLVARFAVVASLGNWYGAFLPAAGLGELRFGASSAVLQGLVRALTPWSVEIAFGVVRITGAVAPVLVMLVVRRLGGSLPGAVVAGVLLALAPITVRLSASSSEHVLAATLALAAWAVWLRGAADVSVVPRLLTIVLVVLAVLTRVDCWPQLALIPLWTVLAGPPPDAKLDWQPRARRVGDALLYGLCWAAIGVYGWYELVLPSNHPGPEIEGIRYTARVLFSQLWVATSEPPHWISWLCFALVSAGFVLALVRRRFGVAAAAVLSLALVFVPLGRNLTHDGLTGARYFVLALPLLTLVAAQVGDQADAWLGGARLRRPLLSLGAVALVGLGIVSARPAWRHEYTFQAEYLFLAEQLEELEELDQLEGCTLWFVRPRQPTSEPDLDCCLAPDRSPLALVAPQLRFRSMPGGRDPADEQGCHLYYVGSLCSIEPELAPRVSRGVARIHEQCDRLRMRGGEDVLGRQEVSERNLNRRFVGPPVVELFGRFE